MSIPETTMPRAGFIAILDVRKHRSLSLSYFPRTRIYFKWEQREERCTSIICYKPWPWVACLQLCHSRMLPTYINNNNNQRNNVRQSLTCARFNQTQANHIGGSEQPVSLKSDFRLVALRLNSGNWPTLFFLHSAFKIWKFYLFSHFSWKKSN